MRYIEELEKSRQLIKTEKDKIKQTRKNLTINYAGNVKKYRNIAGLTQEELADYVGLSRSMIVALEQGKHTGSLDTFLMICKVLNINPNTLIELP